MFVQKKTGHKLSARTMEVRNAAASTLFVLSNPQAFANFSYLTVTVSSQASLITFAS